MRFVTTVFLLGACAAFLRAETPKPPMSDYLQPSSEPHAGAISFEQARIHVGDKELFVEVARTMPQLERGLMQRQTVAPFDGMLFVLPKPQRASFWMKNTPLELEVGFFDQAGVLREIHRMKPFDETPIVSRYRTVIYALELPSGDFRGKGILVGQKIRFDDAKKVLN